MMQNPHEYGIIHLLEVSMLYLVEKPGKQKHLVQSRMSLDWTNFTKY